MHYSKFVMPTTSHTYLSQARDRQCSIAQQPCNVEQHVSRLIGGAEKYTLEQVMEKTELPERIIRRFWQAMGFPSVTDPSRPLFTDYDIDVFRAYISLTDKGLADLDTLNSLIRAQSHFADRQVLWHAIRCLSALTNTKSFLSIR